MNTNIRHLVFAKIENIKRIHDYWQFNTDKGTINIYNPTKCITKRESCDLNESQINGIVNHSILNVAYEESKSVKLELDNAIEIEISLREEDYSGVEAIGIYYDSGEILVFE